ncbi:MAG: CPBP family intramembrane metalloprotease [Kiritimatiellae bacterium]|nr:CPBP family intramembrane metalloprotease [Kiritimatiellia bacterium]
MKRLILPLLVLLGIAGFLTFHLTYDRVFRQASLKIQVPKEKATAESVKILRDFGADVSRWYKTTSFTFDDESLVYMERELGLDRANALLREDRDLRSFWKWDTRFFRPLQKEEFHIVLDMEGRFVGFTHLLDENAAGAKLPRVEALLAASEFAQSRMGYDLAGFTLVEENSTKKAARTDHSFTWERNGFRVKEAPFRLTIRVAGDRVTHVGTWLRVPENWRRDFARMRSWNNMATMIALLAAVPFLLLLLYQLVAGFRAGNLRWRQALCIAGAGTLIACAVSLNSIPLMLMGFDTTQSMGSFTAGIVFSAVFQSLMGGVVLMIIFLAAEPWYRRMMPEHLRMESCLRPSGWRTASFGRAVVAGYSFAFLSMGYVVLFYLASQRLGAWSPPDVRYTDALSTTAPWLYAVITGFWAAASEEGIFRFLAIPFLLWLTRSKIFAVVVPAIVWGFLHCNYPNEPFFIRGVEISLEGILAGLIFLRFGIFATLIYHYTFNCFATLYFFLRCGESSLWLPTIICIGIFLVPFLFALRSLFRGEPDPRQLLNSSDPVRKPEKVEIKRLALSIAGRLTRKASILLALLAVTGILVLIFARPAKFMDSLHLRASRADVANAADKALRDMGQDPAAYTRAIDFDGPKHDQQSFDYAYRKVGFHESARLLWKETDICVWKARYFRPGKEEQFVVFLSPDGRILWLSHFLDDDEKRATPTEEQAKAMASAYLREKQSLRLEDYEFYSASQTKHPNRADTTVSYRRKVPDWKDAYFFVAVTVAGEEVTSFWRDLHVPEEWCRSEDETRALQKVCSGILIGFCFVLALLLSVQFVRLWKNGFIPWKTILPFLVGLGALKFLNILNRLPVHLYGYDTSQELVNYWVMALGGEAVSMAFSLVAAACILGLGAGLYRRYFNEEIRLRPANRQSWLNTLLCAYLPIPVLAAIGTGFEYAEILFPNLVRHVSLEAPEGVSLALPLLDMLISAVESAFYAAPVAMIAVFLLRRYLKHTWTAIVVVLILCTAAALTKRMPLPAAIFRIGENMAMAIVLAILVLRVLRKNILAYFIFIFAGTCFSSAMTLISQGSGIWFQYGLLLILFGLLPALYCAWQTQNRTDPLGARL